MFIELTEVLRCPKPHDEAFVVCVPMETKDRDVIRGVIGCPACRAEYPIIDSVVRYGAEERKGGRADEALPPPFRPSALPSYDAAALAAFLALEGRGGYVVLAGRAARNAAQLVTELEGVHVIAVNPPEGVRPGPMVSVMTGSPGIPLKSHHARGVALGADVSDQAWMSEAERVLLPGLRLIVEDEAARPEHADVLAAAGGVLVAERRFR